MSKVVPVDGDRTPTDRRATAEAVAVKNGTDRRHITKKEEVR